MPTRDALNTVTEDVVRNLLILLFNNVDRFGSLYVILQVYELFIILASKKYGSNDALYRYLGREDADIIKLATARHLICHKLYDRNAIYNIVWDMLDSEVLNRFCDMYFSDYNLPEELTYRASSLVESQEFQW